MPCLSKVPGKSKKKSSGSGGYYGSVAGNDETTTKKAESEVGYLSKNVIYIKTKDGQYATLNVSKNTTNDQILAWGKRFGVDMSPYLN